MFQSTRERALQSPTTHSMKPGLGFFEHGKEPELRAHFRSKPPMMAPVPAATGSLHWVNNSGGSKTMLRWQGNHWEHPTRMDAGNRCAWSPGYLGRAGWSYDKPAD